jgi:hypothetical protein
MTTVRGQILDALIDGLESLEDVGDVIEPMESYFGADAELRAAYASVLGSGKLVVELTAMSDEPVSGDGIPAGMNAEAFRFTVILVAVVPRDFIGGSERPTQLGARVDALLGSVYRGLPKMTFGGLAQHAYRVGGGAVIAVPGTELAAVEHGLVITYRHAHGEPGVVV